MDVASVRFMESLIFENMSRKHGLASEVIAFTERTKFASLYEGLCREYEGLRAEYDELYGLYEGIYGAYEGLRGSYGFIYGQMGILLHGVGLVTEENWTPREQIQNLGNIYKENAALQEALNMHCETKGL